MIHNWYLLDYEYAMLMAVVRDHQIYDVCVRLCMHPHWTNTPLQVAVDSSKLELDMVWMPSICPVKS